MKSTKARSLLAISAVAVAMGLLHACGGGTAGDTSSGTSGTPAASSCPPALPEANSACEAAEPAGFGALILACEYGDAPTPECNASARCVGGKWQVSPGAKDPTCPTRLGPSCPARETIVPGAVCDVAARCGYPSGECACRQNCGAQYPIPPECEAGTPKTWACGKPAQGCPDSRPRYGSPCTASKDLDCNYALESCEEDSYQCKGGAWHARVNVCAVSTASKKTDIHYLSDAEIEELHREALDLRLTRFRYDEGDRAQHLGFIIEDAPRNPAVQQGRDRVDLYAYATMAVGALQAQEKELVSLRHDVDELRAALARERTRTADCRPR